MNCWYCGAENKDDRKYCKKCGSFLHKKLIPLCSAVVAEKKDDVETAVPAIEDVDAPLEGEAILDELEHAGKTGKLVDINNAPVDEIADLPGIGIVLAKRIDTERRERNGFNSLDELVKVIGIRKYVKTRINPLVEFKPLRKSAGYKRRGRVVDY